MSEKPQSGESVVGMETMPGEFDLSFQEAEIPEYREAEPDKRVRKPVTHLGYIRGLVRGKRYDSEHRLGPRIQGAILDLRCEAEQWCEEVAETDGPTKELLGSAVTWLATVEQTATEPDERFATLLELQPQERDAFFEKFYDELGKVGQTIGYVGLPPALADVVSYTALFSERHISQMVKRLEETRDALEREVAKDLDRARDLAREFLPSQWLP